MMKIVVVLALFATVFAADIPVGREDAPSTVCKFCLDQVEEARQHFIESDNHNVFEYNQKMVLAIIRSCENTFPGMQNRGKMSACIYLFQQVAKTMSGRDLTEIEPVEVCYEATLC